MKAFAPALDGTVSIALAATSARTQFQSANVPTQVLVTNNGTDTAFISWGDVSKTASAATGVPIGAGGAQVLTVSGTYIAAISSGAVGSLYVTPGSGI